MILRAYGPTLAVNWRFDLEFDNPCDLNQTTIEQAMKNGTGADYVVSDLDPSTLSMVTIPCHLVIIAHEHTIRRSHFI